MKKTWLIDSAKIGLIVTISVLTTNYLITRPSEEKTNRRTVEYPDVTQEHLKHNSLYGSGKIAPSVQKREQVALDAIAEKLDALNARIDTLEKNNPKTTSHTDLMVESLTDQEKRESKFQAEMKIINDFSVQPIDQEWQQEIETQFFDRVADAEEILEQSGVTITGLECRSDTCKLEVIAEDMGNSGLALTFFPWDNSATTIVDPDDPSKTTFILKKIDPLVSQTN